MCQIGYDISIIVSGLLLVVSKEGSAALRIVAALVVEFRRSAIDMPQRLLHVFERALVFQCCRRKRRPARVR